MSSVAFERLATKMREMAVTEQSNTGTGAERFKVTGLDPLRLDQLSGTVQLEDGDPDFTVGSWMRQFLLLYPLSLGDEVWCLREGAEWHLIDVTEPDVIAPLVGDVLDAGDSELRDWLDGGNSTGLFDNVLDEGDAGVLYTASPITGGDSHP